MAPIVGLAKNSMIRKTIENIIEITNSAPKNQSGLLRKSLEIICDIALA